MKMLLLRGALALAMIVVAPLSIAADYPSMILKDVDVRGSAIATTPPTSDNSTKVATTAFVDALAGAVSIAKYGATCNDAALSAASAAQRTVVIPSGTTCTVAADLTLSTKTRWIIEQGATVSVASTKTLLILGPVDAGRYQIFTGSGSVVGIAHSKPQWWGADGAYGNINDSTAAFQAAVNSSLAAARAADPNNPADSTGIPVVDIGFGFFNLCAPVNIATDTKPGIELRGAGSINLGTWLQTCTTFTGYAPILVNGNPYANGMINSVVLRGFSLNNQVGSGASAGIRFVPEGSGYWINADHKSNIIDDVEVRDFPKDYEIVNTRNLVLRNSGSNGSITSNHTSVAINASGATSLGNGVSEVKFENFTAVPCPNANASTCTNTIGFDISSASAAAINAITWSSSVIYRSNTGIKLRSDGASTWLGDLWIAGDGNQFDGLGCNYIDAETTNGGSMFNVHVDHVYHTGVYANTCLGHYWHNVSGTMTKIWDTNNEFVLGPTGSAIIFQGVSEYVANGNIINGSNNLVDAILTQGSSSNGVIANNVIKGTWRWGITTGPAVSGTNISGNNCYGASLAGGTCAFDNVPIATTTNNVYGNGDPFLGSYTPTITCQSGALGTHTAGAGFWWQDFRLSVEISLTITDNGTCAGRLEVSLPRASFGPHIVSAADISGGGALSAFVPDFDQKIYTSGTYPGVAGHSYYFKVDYSVR